MVDFIIVHAINNFGNSVRLVRDVSATVFNSETPALASYALDDDDPIEETIETIDDHIIDE